MNLSLLAWFNLLALFAVEIAVVVGVACLAQWRLTSGPWRRTLWQTCFLALALWLGFTAVGLSDRVAAWVRVDRPVEKAAPTQPVLTAQFRQTIERRLKEVERLDQAGSVGEGRPSRGGGSDAGKRVPSPGLIPSGLASAAPAGLERSTSRGSVFVSAPVAWPAWLWVAGVLALAGRWLRSRYLRERLGRHSRPVVDPVLHEQVQWLQERLGLGREVRLVESEVLQGPIAYGWLRPTIVVPARFAQAHSLPQQQVMLAHELTHLMAWDPCWYGLAGGLSALLWWHPCVWIARRQLHSASERAADEASLLVRNGPGVLAECLVFMGNKLTGTRAATGISIEGNHFKSSLGRRVARLLSLGGRVWSPPSRVPPLAMKIFVPLLLVLLILVTTAWAAPQPFIKGRTAMKSIRQSYQQILAAAGLSVLLGGDTTRAATSPVELPSRLAVEPTATAGPAPLLDPAQAALPGAPPPPAAPRAKAVNLPPSSAAPPSSPAPPFPGAALAQSEGANIYSASSEEKSAIQRKLKQIVFPEIAWDGVPLGEIIKMLNDQTRKLDPKGEGLNFIVNETLPAKPPVIDPVTGLPLPEPPQVSLTEFIVRISPPVRNVRLLDVLDILKSAATGSLDYTVQDYGIVFAHRLVQEKAPAEPLEVRTFHVDPEMLFQGMESAFGIGLPADSPTSLSPAHRAEIAILEERLKIAQEVWEQTKAMHEQKAMSESELRKAEHEMRLAKLALEKEGQRQIRTPAREIQPQLFRELFLQLGIRLDPPRSVFYNEHTGIVMVRVSAEEMNLVQAAMETLGGSESSRAGRMRPGAGALRGGGGGFGGVSAGAVAGEAAPSPARR